MKPKEYLNELKKRVIATSGSDEWERAQAEWEGANKMWHLFRDKDSAWRDANREAVRKYNREYARTRRAKLKEMEEDIDKISKMD